MSIYISDVECNINIPKHLAKVENPGFWRFGAATWHKLVSPYVPFRTGALDNTVNIEGNKLSGEVKYLVPYAHYQYAGRTTGKTFYSPDMGFSSPKNRQKRYTGGMNYDTSKHPNAGAQWDKRAAPAQRPKLIASMQAYVDGGGLNL